MWKKLNQALGEMIHYANSNNNIMNPENVFNGLAECYRLAPELL